MPSQRDGRLPHANDDFGGRVKTDVLFVAVSGPKFMKFWDNVKGPIVVFNAVSRLCISCFSSELLALKFAIMLRRRRK